MEKVNKLIKFNQNTWPKSYIDMNNDLEKKQKMNLKNFFLKLMDNAVFEKMIENMTKHRDMKLRTTERRRNYLVSETHYHSAKCFTENILAIEMKKKLKYL